MSGEKGEEEKREERGEGEVGEEEERGEREREREGERVEREREEEGVGKGGEYGMEGREHNEIKESL